MNLRWIYFTILVVNLLIQFNASGITTPSISANTLFLYRNSNLHKGNINATDLDQTPNGLNIQEAELQFYSDVDPYTRLSLLLSIAPQYTSDGITVSEEWGVEPEEVFAESNILSDITFKIGKFKAAIGKHNGLHTHAFPFIDPPIANTQLLGDEGLNDVGVSTAILFSTDWFNELTIQYLRGKGENDEFKSPSPSMGVGLAHWKNLFDLNDDLTIEIGASYAQGGNSFSKMTLLSGADLTFKWRPSEGGRYTSLLWSTEYLSRKQTQVAVAEEKGFGFASWVQYQFSERWSCSYRYDQLKVSESFDPIKLLNTTWVKNSLGFIYTPSEFSSYRIEYDHKHSGVKNNDNESTEKTFYLQANFTIGAHPVHAY